MEKIRNVSDKRHIIFINILSILLLALLLGSVTPLAAAAGTGGERDALEQPESWLLKWQDPAQARRLRGVEVLHRQSETAVDLVRPAADAGEDVEQWLRRVSGEPGVAYVHPNLGVRILSAPAAGQEPATTTPPAAEGSAATSPPAEEESAPPATAEPSATPEALSLRAAAVPVKANDPELAKQAYLSEIGAIKAWETVRSHTGLTIALIDTGIDLDHPDLKDNLVPGINLIDAKKPPEDDNGHGTSVAGVIAAGGNNGVGIAGLLWNAKLMPVKALDQWGDGTEKDLGEGILQAIKKNAKIIVMSVGLYRYSPYMLDIVRYAESQGVLLVAAAGNDGVSLGGKATVKYPAAYPTVLAVGGAKSGGSPDPRSNAGPELDLLAPWHVYTTAVGGGYKKEEGTSLAAPQVAAAAALVWAQNPSLSPAEVRALLRQTARDVGAAGIDAESGYGMLQLDRAVTGTLSRDAYEPNDSSAAAATFPLGSQLLAELTTSADEDWYTIDVPYDGKLTIALEGMPTAGQVMPAVRIAHYRDGKLQRSEDARLASKSVDFDVKKGKQHIQVHFGNPNQSQALSYSLTSSFVIAADAYEPNDRLADARTLQPTSQILTGTFHQTADRDWFVVDFKQSGKLQVSASTNTARIDLGLSLQREGQSLTIYDERGEGGSESTAVISVTPGKYYIRVHNAISLDASPVMGTYSLQLDFKPQLDDPNEPNDKSFEALMMSAGTEYLGVIDRIGDIDWFQFRLNQESIVSLNVTGVPNDVSLRVDGYDKRMSSVATAVTGTTGALQTREVVLQPGVYYVKLTADNVFHQQYYRLKVKVEELVSGFRDISGHWAREDIVALSGAGIINGVGNYRFEPNRATTRAEAIAMIVKAYKPISSGLPTAVRFTDVKSTHWANDAIAKAVQQGWVNGFPDGSFRPEQPVTRAEMAVMIGKAQGMKPRVTATRPFSDVAVYEWYSPMLMAMKTDGKLRGVEADLFKPNDKATRASFSTLLYRYYRNA